MKKNKPIISAVIIGLVLAGIFFVLWPEFQEFSQLRSQYMAKQKELEYKKTYFDNLAKLSLELKKYSNQITKVDSMLPENASLPEDINFLNKAAIANGVSLDDFKIGKASSLKQNSKIEENSVSATVTGTYQGLKNFLLALQSSARIFELQSISFSQDKELNKKVETSFSLSIKSYSY